MRIRRGSAAALLFVIAGIASGCASTGSTFRSGVGDTFLRRAPWYAGAGDLTGPVAHVPIAYQADMFDPSAREGSAVALLLRDMNAWLDSAGTGVRIAAPAAGTPPDVHFGCERTPDDDCEEVQDGEMRLAVGRPSQQWIDGARAAAATAGAPRVLVITLEVGNYLPRQRGILGGKEVELGTGHTVDVPWLTALDRPVSVLQLTGALMDTTGRAVRIGAEGLVARRTNIIASGFGLQALITEKDVEALRTARREDLPGQPLVWQEALRNLVASLTGTPR